MLLFLICVNDIVFRPSVSFTFTQFKTHRWCWVSTARIPAHNLSALEEMDTSLCHQLPSKTDSATQAVAVPFRPGRVFLLGGWVSSSTHFSPGSETYPLPSFCNARGSREPSRLPAVGITWLPKVCQFPVSLFNVPLYAFTRVSMY